MRLRKEEGYITVEATISLTIYIFAFMMIFSIIHLCRVQMKISVAINNAAKEVSQYSYLYGVSGLSGSLSAVAKRSLEEQAEYKNIGSDVSSLYGQIVKLGDGGGGGFNVDNIHNLQDELGTVKNSAASLKSKLKKKIEDPKEMLMGLCSVLVAEGNEAINNVAAEYLAKALVRQNLKRELTDSDAEIEDYLHSMGLKKTSGTYFESIDFQYSRLFPDGENEIKIVAVYEVRVLPLLDVVDSSFTIVQTARTRAWLMGDEDE